MSVSKNRATASLLASEKRSLTRFFILYGVLTFLLIGGVAYYYYESQKALMLSDKRVTLSRYAYEQTKRIKALHHAFPKERTYPRDDRFTSAIYDIEFHRIFSLNGSDPDDFFQEIRLKDGIIQYIKDLDVFYLGARFLVIEVPDDGRWSMRAWRHIAVYGGAALVLLGLLGVFLARLFVKPMRDAILLLDRFIADTTHELNTPLSTMLANIETIDRNRLDRATQKKLDRIAVAAKKVSVLYRDLTYLVLEKNKSFQTDTIELEPFLRSRIHYFETLAQSQNVRLEAHLQKACIQADIKDLERIVDNLISNAIKYNINGGKVTVTLDRDKLIVEDTGIGIDEEKLPFLFDRYMRLTQQHGGFGVGLSIVKSICERYRWRVNVTSKSKVGTRFEIIWKEEDRCAP